MLTIVVETLKWRAYLALLERGERFVVDRWIEGWLPEQIAGPPWPPDHGCFAAGSRGLEARDDPGRKRVRRREKLPP
jgi:hypothetical protein